jgi:hypothetical protein
MISPDHSLCRFGWRLHSREAHALDLVVDVSVQLINRDLSVAGQVGPASAQAFQERTGEDGRRHRAVEGRALVGGLP